MVDEENILQLQDVQSQEPSLELRKPFTCQSFAAWGCEVLPVVFLNTSPDGAGFDIFQPLALLS